MEHAAGNVEASRVIRPRPNRAGALCRLLARNRHSEAFKRTRCLIPVSGYYEWQETPSGKQPYYFTARDGSPALTIAGLWDEWRDRESGETLRSCTMIITEPNALVAEVHDRMPVLLAEE
jgi:putative SOS response-associated peptidase YedK